MSFGIYLHLDFSFDPESGKYYINGIEITPEDVSFIETYQLELLQAVKNNIDVELSLSPQVIELLEKKYYKN